MKRTLAAAILLALGGTAGAHTQTGVFGNGGDLTGSADGHRHTLSDGHGVHHHHEAHDLPRSPTHGARDHIGVLQELGLIRGGSGIVGDPPRHEHDPARHQHPPSSHRHTEYASQSHIHRTRVPDPHSHTEYAATDHPHDGYAGSEHSHSPLGKSWWVPMFPGNGRLRISNWTGDTSVDICAYNVNGDRIECLLNESLDEYEVGRWDRSSFPDHDIQGPWTLRITARGEKGVFVTALTKPADGITLLPAVKMEDE